MKIIFYANNMNKIRKTFESEIQKDLSRMEFQTSNSITMLLEILRQPLNRISVIVILISSKDELKEFISIISFFENIRVILILPDREKQTVSLGMKLYPSFISYTDSGAKDTCAVLKKIQAITREN